MKTFAGGANCACETGAGTLGAVGIQTIDDGQEFGEFRKCGRYVLRAAAILQFKSMSICKPLGELRPRVLISGTNLNLVWQRSIDDHVNGSVAECRTHALVVYDSVRVARD